MRGGVRPNQTGRPPAEHSRAKDRAAAKSERRVIDDGVWLTLPHAGRGGNPPAWPLSAASKRERDVWRKLWKLPEAVGWERAGNALQVALFVRTLVRVEQADSPVGLISQVRIQQAELGLTAAGKMSLKWRVAQPPRPQSAAKPIADPEPVTAPLPVGPSPKDRLLRAVPDAG